MKKGKVYAKQAEVLKQLSENIRNGKGNSLAQAQRDVGYSESYANTNLITKTDGWQKALEEALPDSLLLKVHKEGLEASKTISATNTSIDADEKSMDFIEVPDHPTRHKFLDTGYKIKRQYDNTVRVTGAITQLSDSELQEAISGILSEALGALAGEEPQGTE